MQLLHSLDSIPLHSPSAGGADRRRIDPTTVSLLSPHPRHAPVALLLARAAGRALVYLWVLPTTALGLLFLPLALFSRDGGAKVVDGVLELHGAAVAFFLRHCTLLRGGASA